MAIDKSVTEWVSSLVNMGWTDNIEVIQGQACFVRKSGSNKHYTMFILYNQDSDEFMFCKLYGPVGKWTGWDNVLTSSRVRAESLFDEALAKRRGRGYTDDPIYELDHATVCLRGILKLGKKVVERSVMYSASEYTIIRNFATHGVLASTDMRLLNGIYKLHLTI